MLVSILTLLALTTVNGSLLPEVFFALDKTISYLIDYDVHFNIDGHFGVAIAIGHLQKTLENDYIPEKFRLKINSQLNTLQKILEDGRNDILTRTISDFEFLKLFTNVNNWKKDIDFNQKLIPEHINPSLPKSITTEENYKEFVSFTSKFNESFSDECLWQILKSSKVNKNCPISDDCLNFAIKDTTIKPAYTISHRLLFLMLSEAVGCNWNIELKNNLKQTFCSYMFWEANVMGSLKFNSRFGDLFLEQVCLCGMEGFSDFLNLKWIKHVINIQSIQGCYISYANYRIKRMANPIGFGCSDHSTGLAIADLALFIRYLLTANILE